LKTVRAIHGIQAIRVRISEARLYLILECSVKYILQSRLTTKMWWWFI